jgi:endonuclease/exonuclease/phosphatase family metal-dependent hydrolase
VTGRSLTVASYNIHKAQGLDRRVDVGRIACVLGELGADVIGLQEVFRGQAHALADTLGMTAAMGVVRETPRGPYGNCVLTHLPIVGSHGFDLSQRGREPRGGVRADLDVGGGILHLFNVHLGLRFGERAAQVALLVAQHVHAQRAPGLRVLLGDLNEWFPAAVGRTLRREFHGRRVRRTHPAPAPLFALDRIYWDAGLHGAGLHVHRSRLARVASDHLPVVARFRLDARPDPALAPSRLA